MFLPCQHTIVSHWMSAGIMRMGSSSPQGLITIDEVTSTLILRRAAILPLSVIHSVSFYQSTIYIYTEIHLQT